MADRAGATGDDTPGSDFREADLVSRVTGGGGQPAATVTLRGLVGQGAADGTRRLYLSQHFDEYVEFDAVDVVHSQVVDESVPLAGTVVWVRAGARLQYTHVSSREVQADFLQGGVTATHLSRAGAASFAPADLAETGYVCTRNYVCSINPHIPACRQRTEFCGSLNCGDSGAVCPTGAFVVNC